MLSSRVSVRSSGIRSTAPEGLSWRGPYSSPCVSKPRPVYTWRAHTPLEGSFSRSTSGPATRRDNVLCAAASTPTADSDWEDYPLPEGDLGLPIIGQTFTWLRTYTDFYNTRFNKHGKIWKMRVLGQNVVVIADNESIRRLLAQEHKLVESSWPRSMQKLLGDYSILRAPASKHQPTRRLLNQAFTPSAIASYTPTIYNVVNNTLEEWAKEGSFKAWEGCRGLAFDVAAVVLLGRQMDAQTVYDLRRKFERFVGGMFSVPVDLPITQFGKSHGGPPRDPGESQR
eukprot:jgi/Botrbrau1/9104/Bobra.0305s0011.1